MVHSQDQRAALIIAHPGHELRIHHWLELVRPLTFILTDGSGHSDRSRLHASTATLQNAGAKRGSIYGAMSDRELYRAILGGDRELFVNLADDLALALQREGVTCVVGDAAEGFNPGHDVCRLVVNAAVARIDGTSSHSLKNMEFTVEGPPQPRLPQDRAEAEILELDDEALARKVAAVRAYPELAAEVDRVLTAQAVETFRTEYLLPVQYGFDLANRFEHPCFYEQYGEKQVAAGFYRDVIRFKDHVGPVAAHLERFVGANSRAANPTR